MAWEYATNFSNGTAVTSLGTFLQYSNYVTNGLLSYAFLIIIFLISFIGSLMVSSKKALLSASFITFIFSIYFLRLDLINPMFVFLLIVGIIAGAIGTKNESSNF